MPINFFGRVVDEKGQPVPRATIVAQWSDLSPRGATDETFLSDDQGFFSMTEKTGRGITIRVSKDGYYTPKRQQISFDAQRRANPPVIEPIEQPEQVRHDRPG